ncbi:MAG: polysaccharide pyruvyl transferase family protein [Dehalococcoidia bacterium]|nr:polysaccharide pyruvyl transferase family protein [Dehalococcoidia bacterium]
MYTLLTGAKKNVGDFLIAERGKRLLKTYSTAEEFLEFPRWESLDEKLDEVNRTKAVILVGGPGYERDFYPDIFPLARHIDDIKIPIIPFGLGWDGSRMWHSDKFSFSKSSRFLLERIHGSCVVTSCRDNATQKILNRHGFNNVIMTGCPAWYDLESIGKKFEQPKDIHRVAISMTPTSAFLEQNVQLLEELRELLKPLYPGVELFATFHRGIVEDRFTPKGEAKNLRYLAKCAEELAYRVVDASYNISNIEFYRTCDFHVGFRVHAHVFFLSVRKPTFLLQVDGRGLALSQTLGLSDVPLISKAGVSSGLNYLMQGVKDSLPPKWIHVLSKIAIARQVNEARTPHNQGAIKAVMKQIEAELLNGFPKFQGMGAVLDQHFDDMVSFLKTLPK